MFTRSSVVAPMDACVPCAPECFPPRREAPHGLSGLSLDVVLISAKLTAVKRIRNRLAGACDAVSRWTSSTDKMAQRGKLKETKA